MTIIVTKVQAELIEKVKEGNYYESVLRRVLNGTEIPNPIFRPLSELSFVDLMSAFVKGYAIKQPKFEIEDIVVRLNGGVFTNGIKFATVSAVKDNGAIYFKETGTWLHEESIRLATEEEKFWAELGREVGQLKPRDGIRLLSGESYTIGVSIAVVDADEYYKAGKITGFYPAESFKPFPTGNNP